MGGKSYILVGEDDPDDRFLLQTAADELQLNCGVTFVENGVDLLDFLEEQHVKGTKGKFPEFILLDLNMPRKDGREVLAKIKTTDAYQEIPVIIFSTTSNEHEMKRCYELGANSYITKPNSFEVLQDTLKALYVYWLEKD